MNALRSVWGVLVDLVVGDDPKIAGAVVVVLGVALVMSLAGVAAPVVVVGGALLVAATFGVVLAVDVRRSVSRRGD